MGVVHLARRGGRRSGSRSRCCGRTSSATTRRAPAGPRGRLAVPDPQPVGRRDRRRRPVGADPVRRHPLRPGPVAARLRARGGPDHGQDLTWFADVPRRGRRLGARGRRPAPRRQALQRADGGPDADPDRLRPGPGRRRPEADPHRLAARHARATSRPRSCTATTPRTASDVHSWAATVAFAATGRPPFGRGPVDGDHGPGPPRRARPHRPPRPAAPVLAAALDPEPARRPTLDAILGWLRPQVAAASRPRAAARAASRRAVHGAARARLAGRPRPTCIAEDDRRATHEDAHRAADRPRADGPAVPPRPSHRSPVRRAGPPRDLLVVARVVCGAPRGGVPLARRRSS